MKFFFTILSLSFISIFSKAQSVYNAASYAAIGDTVHLTSAQVDTTNYVTGGAGYTWNFKALKGTSQQNLLFRNPKSTGFTQLQWPYIYNTANVNLSSTNGQSVALGQLEESNNNDYYFKSNGALAEKASSFNIAYSNVALNIKNVYTSADTLYKFPLAYTDTFASACQYTTSLPGIYYNMQTLKRTNKIDGWGTAITPYGTFTHCLRVVSNVVQVDTFAFYGTGLPKDTIQYRELKWLDSTKNYPVLYVKQTFAAGKYTTTLVQYYDKQQYFQPQALFAYVPLLPGVNDTVTFQNLSTNSTASEWSFGDGATSAEINPQHVFTAAGTYPVKLIAYNGSLTDTLIVNVKVSSTPVAQFSYTPLLPLVKDTVTFINYSISATAYSWNFGDGTSSAVKNPYHIYTVTGTYNVTLIAINGTLADTVVQAVNVGSSTNAHAAFTYTPANPVTNEVVQFQNLSTNGAAFLWNFGDGAASTAANPSYIYSKAGTYQVKLVAIGANGSKDSISENIIVLSGSLPIQLVSFTGAKQKSGNVLQWSTATETNTAYFGVERSLNGLSFGSIASVTAAGNSNTLRNYSFEDINAAAGDVYYRLKITDKDGHFNYSNIVVLKDALSGTALALYPNPVVRNKQATVLINCGTAAKATIIVYNVNGKALITKQVQLAVGVNSISLPVNNFVQGTYFLTYQAANGGLAGRLAFVVAH